jgi:hypothetical protein
VGAGRHIHGILAVGAVLVVAMLSTDSAFGSSGEITQAQASSDWSHASIAGIVYRTDACVDQPAPTLPPWDPELAEPPEYFPRCGWIPYATLGPAAPEDDCSSSARRWPTIGEGVQIVWEGGERTGVGSAPFELPEVPLQYGSDAPLLCLSVVEAAVEGIFCVQIVGFPCPPFAIVPRRYQLDSALLSVQPQVPGAPGSGSPPGAEQKPSLHRRHCRRRRQRAEQKSSLGLQRRVTGSAPCRSRHHRRDRS